LVETTLPSVCMALEKLLIEVEKKGLTNPAMDRLFSNLEFSDALDSRKPTAPAAEKLELPEQPDKPLASTFQPIHWIGKVKQT
jgi:hypothetical protein